MILEPRHLYKASIKRHVELYNSHDKNYVLICPMEEYDVGDSFRDTIYSFVSIDIDNKYSEKKCIFLTGQSFQFEKPSLKDVFEITQRMKEENSEYRYYSKTNEIKIEEKL